MNSEKLFYDDDAREETVGRTMNQSKEQWRVYNATSRYQIDPKLVEWYYPAEDYLKKMSKANTFETEEKDFEKADDEDFFFYNNKDDFGGVPRYKLDDYAIRMSNSKVLDKLIPKISPPDTYFEPGELAVINSDDNPLRTPCRHIFSMLFISLANNIKKNIRSKMVKEISSTKTHLSRTFC